MATRRPRTLTVDNTEKPTDTKGKQGIFDDAEAGKTAGAVESSNLQGDITRAAPARMNEKKPLTGVAPLNSTHLPSGRNSRPGRLVGKGGSA